jgi:DNA-binding MurR/RpiR family transcriptional regulator
MRNPTRAARIKQQTTPAAQLSGANAIVANYIRDNRLDVAMETSRQISARLGVSNATVVRTAQHLGFRGFKELRDALRKALLSGV